jgi:short-subunit dehydrogenase
MATGLQWRRPITPTFVYNLRPIFGLIAITRAILPDMRAAGRGTIINVSSGGGRMAQPRSGYYSATKFAAERLSDALRNELQPLGIHVMVVEPGGFQPTLLAARYGNPHERAMPMRPPQRFEAKRISPHTVANPAITNQAGKYISQPGSRGVADIWCLEERPHLIWPAL